MQMKRKNQKQRKSCYNRALSLFMLYKRVKEFKAWVDGQLPARDQCSFESYDENMNDVLASSPQQPDNPTSVRQCGTRSPMTVSSPA